MTRTGQRALRRGLLAGVWLTCIWLAGVAPAAAQTAPPPPVQDIGVDERVGARVPLDLAFVNTSGEAVRLGDYFGDGKPVLLIMAYNRCPMLCSLVLNGAADVLGKIDGEPGDDYQVITVSIDPSETPHEAARKQEVFLEGLGHAGERARWPFLVGEEQAIRALADSLGFRYTWDARTSQYAHPAVVFVLGPDGMISRYLHGVRIEAAVLEAALGDAGHGLTGESLIGTILSCFRFEAALQKYGAVIENMFRVGALLILAVLVAVMVLLFRRERRKS